MLYTKVRGRRARVQNNAAVWKIDESANGTTRNGEAMRCGQMMETTSATALFMVVGAESPEGDTRKITPHHTLEAPIQQAALTESMGVPEKHSAGRDTVCSQRKEEAVSVSTPSRPQR